MGATVGLSGSSAEYGRTPLVIVQTICPPYRLPLFRELDEQSKGGFRLVTGTEYYDRTVPHVATVKDGFHQEVENRFFFERRMMLQRLPSLLERDPTPVVLEFNPRNLSAWSMLIARKRKGLPTMLWGHLFGRGQRGRGAVSAAVRRTMYELADQLVVYTEEEAEFGRQELGIKACEAAPNALYLNADSPPAPIVPRNYGLLSISRLAPNKEIRLLIEGWSLARSRLPVDAMLYVVGAGPEENFVREVAADPRNQVTFCGPTFDYEALHALYAKCDMAVSAGFVGLSATQSAWFGRRMIYPKDAPHAPEIEVLKRLNSGVPFQAGSATDLADKIVVSLMSEPRQDSHRDLSARARANYSMEAMAKTFIELARVWSGNESRRK